jgi:hypothetical protein
MRRQKKNSVRRRMIEGGAETTAEAPQLVTEVIIAPEHYR